MTSVSDNLLERVARAIFVAAGEGEPDPDDFDFDKVQEHERDFARKLARAAIEASNDLVGEMEAAAQSALLFLEVAYIPDTSGLSLESVTEELRTALSRMRDARNGGGGQ